MQLENDTMKHSLSAVGLIAACLIGLTLAALPARQAHANTTFAKELHLSCDTCHIGGVDPKKATLNAIGIKFLQCTYDAACAGLTGAPVHNTSQNAGGAARFVNNSCGAARRWITLRHQSDGPEHNIAISVAPGGMVQVAVTAGTVFTEQCGQPADDGKWQYVILD